MSQIQRLIVAGVLFAAWAAAVYLNLAPINPFIDFLRDSLLGLGVFHAALTNPNGRAPGADGQ